MNGIECTLYTLIDIISNFDRSDLIGSRFDNLANNYILIWGGGEQYFEVLGDIECGVIQKFIWRNEYT